VLFVGMPPVFLRLLNKARTTMETPVYITQMGG